jgi:hypothetical protein
MLGADRSVFLSSHCLSPTNTQWSLKGNDLPDDYFTLYLLAPEFILKHYQYDLEHSLKVSLSLAKVPTDVGF